MVARAVLRPQMFCPACGGALLTEQLTHTERFMYCLANTCEHAGRHKGFVVVDKVLEVNDTPISYLSSAG